MIKQSILNTITYFDLSNHPLTILEIYKFLIKTDNFKGKVTFSDLQKVLSELCLEKKIENLNGFYTLFGRLNLVNNRIFNNYPLYMKRIGRAVRVAKILRFLPFIKGIAITGSLASMHSNENSDIDFLVIAKKGRLWIVRLELSFVTQILGVRRYGRNTANRICLNHYIASGYSLPSDHTLYTALEYSSMLVILGADEFNYFYKNQSWISEFLVNPPEIAQISSVTINSSKIIVPIFNFLCNVLGANFWEKVAKYFQEKRIQFQDGIVINNDEISLHPSPKGVDFIRKYQDKMS